MTEVLKKYSGVPQKVADLFYVSCERLVRKCSLRVKYLIYILLLCRDHFYQFGEIRSINIIPKQQCAFVQFTNRQAAEQGAESSFNKLILNGRRLIIKWGKSQAGKEAARAVLNDETGQNLEPVPGLPGRKSSLNIILISFTT